MFTDPDQIRLSDSKQIDSGALVQLYAFGWWSNQRTKPDVERMLAHTSIAVSAWDGELLVGFTRLLTDFTYRATIWDVIVRPEYRGRGIGRRLIEYALKHPQRATVTFFWLSTPDKHGFYEQFGFVRDSSDSVILTRAAASTCPARVRGTVRPGCIGAQRRAPRPGGGGAEGTRQGLTKLMTRPGI